MSVSPLKNIPGCLVLLCLTCSCSLMNPRANTTDEFILYHELKQPVWSDFQICYQHGCNKTAGVNLSENEWRQIKQHFIPAPKNAESERDCIAKAVQALENMVGRKTGIDSDMGGTFPGLLELKENQMDCEDEAVNTNVFLYLMEQDNLIRFHEFYGIAHRGFFAGGWPHMACAIVDIKTQEKFVVDSWFSDQGMPVHVLPYTLWKSGWKPNN